MDFRFDSTRAALKTWFEERAPRERVLLVLGGGVIVAALIYNLLRNPAYSGRVRIAGRLPMLEAGVADAQMQLVEIRRLRVAAAIHPPAGKALREAVASSLAQSGMGKAQVSVVGRGIKVDAKAAPFGVWMIWLDRVRRDEHVRVVSAHAIGERKPGLATVSVMLESQSE